MAAARFSSYLLRKLQRKANERLILAPTVTTQETIYRQNQRLP
ncbi:hypothetical protein BURMUCGD2M_4097 [Burkholderia multivorans CGD2M]|uniref:Uncharacterized protein n=1 Tax=Burkholderia multivorans CGD2 TaxID=513052 RepID=B9BRU1_9BURK|nr:hypothetical protein BURMUCGD2_4108 [Burkholderia multivorans CGD2]EEE12133.1 hypothetical protein BURMUCGD2M_4097 [Burkholderia multivorans CGD2M]